jgi:hypothetical protein
MSESSELEHGKQRHFFEIAIYRCPVEKHEAEHVSIRQKGLRFYEDMRTADPDGYAGVSQSFEQRH